MLETLAKVEDFARFLETYEENYQALLDRVSAYDIAVQKRLHWLEKNNFNAAEGYKFAKELQGIQKARREIKVSCDVVQSFRSTFINNHKGMGVTLFKSAKAMRRVLESQDKKTYEATDRNGNDVGEVM